MLNSKDDICPAHPDWNTLTPREKSIWEKGYSWGQQDAESDYEFDNKLGEWKDA